MIYFKLRTGEQKILSIRGTFARQEDTGADLDQAMGNAAIGPFEETAKVTSQKPRLVMEREWYSADQLSGSYDGFMIDRLISCAAVLSYDEESKLVNVGHAIGGFIDKDQLNQIRTLCGCGTIQHIIYATPTLSTHDTGAEEDYKEEITRLVDAAGNSRIYIIDGFGSGIGSIEGTVYGDMMGNICFH